MQQIEFITKSNERLTFGMDPPLVLAHVDGISGTPSTIQGHQAPFQDGTTVVPADIRYEPRGISITFSIKGDSRYNAYQWRRRIGHLLNTNRGMGTLIYTNNYGKYEIEAIPQQSPIQTERHQNWLKMTAFFLCPFPFFREVSGESTVSLAKVMPLFEFPYEMVRPDSGIEFASMSEGYRLAVNRGDCAAGVTISFMGPSEKPRITNVDTGEFIQVDASIEAGDKMIITTGFGNKTVIIIHEDGSEEDAFEHINPATTFW